MQKLSSYMNFINTQSIEDASRIFTVIHISTDHLLSDNCALDPPNSHVHSHHIHTISVHTVHIHTASLSTAVTSTPHTSPHSPLKLTHSMEDASGICIFIHISPDHLLSDIALDPPALMSTTTTSTQLSSTSITPTHPLSTTVTSATLVLHPSPKILATETTMSTTEVFVVSLFGSSRNLTSRTRHCVDDRGGAELHQCSSPSQRSVSTHVGDYLQNKRQQKIGGGRYREMST